MRGAAVRRYVRLEDADAVELPYQGGELAVWLVVPHDPVAVTVVADRPFLWAIVHQSTAAVVFVGRLVDPTK